ncbi:MAG: thiamine-phosphate kinase [Bacteroidales bacterium]|nr:thiamine-phosphate kinase [Bacteroidales bacterium]
MEQSKKASTIEELGEFGLIEHLTENFSVKNKNTIKAVGDDAAVIDAGNDLLLVSTDILVEGIHFDLIYTPLKHLGYKSVVVNLSDIYAMNGKPEQITVAISVSGKLNLRALEDLYEGIKMACERYEVDLVGGDTTTSITGTTISISALGRVEKNQVVYRNGAKVNDLICVTGDLGAAYLGLQLLEREKNLFIADQSVKPDISNYPYCVERILKPENKPKTLKKLQEANILPNAMIDISDGLSSDILHICKQSQVSCKIYEDKIPINIETAQLAQEFFIDPSVAALNGGEDYELLFTIDQKYFEIISEMPEISIIGYISDKSEESALVARNGVEVPLKAQGWRHIG